MCGDMGMGRIGGDVAVAWGRRCGADVRGHVRARIAVRRGSLCAGGGCGGAADARTNSASGVMLGTPYALTSRRCTVACDAACETASPLCSRPCEPRPLPPARNAWRSSALVRKYGVQMGREPKDANAALHRHVHGGRPWTREVNEACAIFKACQGCEWRRLGVLVLTFKIV